VIEHRKRKNRGDEWDGEWGAGIPLPSQPGGLGSVVSSPSGVCAKPRPKTILVRSGGARTALDALVTLALVANSAFLSRKF